MSNEAHHSVTETATGWTTISTFNRLVGDLLNFLYNWIWVLSTEDNALEERNRPLIATPYRSDALKFSSIPNFPSKNSILLFHLLQCL